MKKSLYYLLAICLFLSISSCTNPIADVSEELEEYTEQIQLQRGQAAENLSKTNLDSLILNNPTIDTRGGKVEFLDKTYYVQGSHWKGFQFTKSTLSTFKIFIEIQVLSGSFKTYAYGYDYNNGYQFIRKNNTKTYISEIDLQSYEDEGYIGVHAFSGGNVRIKLFYERLEEDSSGGSNQALSAKYYQCNPSSGIANQTNFEFKLKINSGNPNTSIIRFYAPDNKYYPFNMSKSGNYYKHNRKLSQIGTYYYRYEIADGNENKYSQWYSVKVNSGSGDKSNILPNNWTNYKQNEYNIGVKCGNTDISNYGCLPASYLTARAITDPYYSLSFTNYKKALNGMKVNCAIKGAAIWDGVNYAQTSSELGNKNINNVSYGNENSAISFIESNLEKGLPVIALMRTDSQRRALTHGGYQHWVVIIGITSSKIKYIDPFTKNTILSHNISDFMKSMRSASSYSSHNLWPIAKK